MALTESKLRRIIREEARRTLREGGDEGEMEHPGGVHPGYSEKTLIYWMKYLSKKGPITFDILEVSEQFMMDPEDIVKKILDEGRGVATIEVHIGKM